MLKRALLWTSLAVAVAACSSDVTPPDDSFGLRILSTTPTNGSTNASRLPIVAVTFSNAVVSESINANSIVVTADGTTTPIYGTVDYDAAAHTADFWPIALLPARTSIIVTVGTDVRDPSGAHMAAPAVFRFTTGDAPASVSDLPAHDTHFIFSQNINKIQVGKSNFEIFITKTDGGSPLNLTNNPAGDFDAAWSPDGRHIAFSSDRSGNLDIFIMRDDGRGLRQVTSSAADESQPRWSPDAKRIFFRSTKEGVAPPGHVTTWDIFAINPDGTAEVNLTRTPMLYETWPALSPDGMRMIYTRTEVLADPRETSTAMYRSNADGSSPIALHSPKAGWFDDVAAWSPDGKTIAFSMMRDICCAGPASDFQIFLLNSDGSNLRQFTFGPSDQHRFPAWSPDGQSLLNTTTDREAWSLGGDLEIEKRDIVTGQALKITPNDLTSVIMSPQAWRR